MYWNELKIEVIPVDSSNVSGIGYDTESQTLAIEMLDNHLYYYLDVPIEHYNGLLNCKNAGRWEISSIGSYLHRNLKGSYRYVRIR